MLGGTPILRSKDKLCTHGDLTTGKVANVVVVEIRIPGDAESSSLRSHASDSFRALIEQVEDLGADLKVKSSVGPEACVL